MLEWDRRRDYFPASVAAHQLNKLRIKESDKVWTPEDILNCYYAKPKESVIITQIDPDRGAAGGESLRAGLREYTKVAKRKRERLKAHGRLHC